MRVPRVISSRASISKLSRGLLEACSLVYQVPGATDQACSCCCCMDRGRAALAYRYQRPPVPPRRLLTFFLLRQTQLTGWRAVILGPSLSHLLGSCRTSAVLILHIGLEDVLALRLLYREVFAIFRQILDNCRYEHRLLQRAYYY